MRLQQAYLKVTLLITLFVLCFSVKAKAHFVWVYKEDGKIKVVFGEDLEPDQVQFLSGLSDLKAFALRDDSFEIFELQKQVEGDDGWLEAPAANFGSVVEVACPYGVFGRGDKAMFLDYSAKYVVLPTSGIELNDGKPSPNLALDLVPKLEGGNLSIVAHFQGRPARGAEVSVDSVDAKFAMQTAGETGEVVLSPTGRYVIRAKYTVAEPGEFEGKKFSERRYYCTMVLDTAGEGSAAIDEPASNKVTEASKPATLTIQKIESRIPEFPKGMTSFGATALNDSIYVMGGKSGRAHSYAKSYQNRNVYRLNLNDADAHWEIVGDNLGLQGLAIVGRGKTIYRIGGLEARNDEGDDHDLHSIGQVLAFNPVEKSWAELPVLPEGRSSFDACIVGSNIFVVGGWTMAGDTESVWASDILKFDLSDAGSKWESIKAPFKTRALAVRSHRGKLAVIGGIQESAGPTNDVHFFDLETEEWTVGPEVPADGDLGAFGCSAVSIGGDLLVSTYDGGIFHLAKAFDSQSKHGDSKQEWHKIHQLECGRFFHQMVPIGESKFALLGGSHMEHGSHLEVEVFQIVKGTLEKVANQKGGEHDAIKSN